MAQPSRINVEYGPNAVIVRFLDKHILDEELIGEIRRQLEPLVEKNGSGELLLNFENVESMTSAMLGLLVRVHKRVVEKGGSLSLVRLDPNLQKVFRITQLDKIFDIS